jgi:hypothetical protein
MTQRCHHLVYQSLFLAGLTLGIQTVYTPQVHAQNIQRIEEEAIKDQERDEKLKQFLKEREEQEKELLSKPISIEDLERKNLVEVEPNNILPSDLVSTYSLVPYKIRRPRWGHYFSVGYSLYEPKNYQTDYLDATQGSFAELYGTPQTPFLEFSYTYKWNVSIGSIGGEAAYAFYQNDTQDELLGDAALELQNIRVGFRWTLDTLWDEPRIAPYVVGGGYTVIYSETQANLALDGTTMIAPYYAVGVLLQLGWLDKQAAVDAYTESGIENTYLFVEGRQYMASSQVNDPDFSTGLDVGGGLSIEF